MPENIAKQFIQYLKSSRLVALKEKNKINKKTITHIFRISAMRHLKITTSK